MDRAENELLTQVGPGTPMGEVLRRYWWPVWFSEQVDRKPVPVRLLGEDFILFRQPDGNLGFLERYCAHRRVSLEFGRVEESGIRCCYHGWKYDCSGQCIDQPMEPAGSKLKDEVKMKAFAVTEAGGLVFANIGPQPVPELPRFDLLYHDEGLKVVGADEEHCNWVQRAENTVDQHHLGVLHASVYPQIAMKRAEIEWQETPYGIRVLVLDKARKPKVTHFMLPSGNRFTQARVGEKPSHNIRLRVPVDDTLTRTFWVTTYPSVTDQGKLRTEGLIPTQRGVYERVQDGWWDLPSHEQDRAAQESQGLITDRATEYLGTTDAGIVMFRRLMRDAMRAVAEGRDPPGIIRDANAGIIDLDATMEEIGALTA